MCVCVLCVCVCACVCCVTVHYSNGFCAHVSISGFQTGPNSKLETANAFAVYHQMDFTVLESSATTRTVDMWRSE